jgi:hypothetical protein
MGAGPAVEFTAVFGAIGKEHAMLPLRCPPHQQVRRAGQDILGQDNSFHLSLQAPAQLFQEGSRKEPARAQPRLVRRRTFANNFMDCDELFAPGKLVLIDQ